MNLSVELPTGGSIVPVRPNGARGELNRRYAGAALLVFVRNKLGLHRAVRERAQTILGPLINRLTGEEPDTVLLGGRIIEQLFREIDRIPPYAFDRSLIYRIRAGDLETLVARIDVPYRFPS